MDSSPPHTLYIPYPAPSVFHLFGALTDAIRGKSFGIEDDVNEKVTKWLRLQKSNWHKNDLVARWPNAVDVDGDCVKKRGM